MRKHLFLFATVAVLLVPSAEATKFFNKEGVIGATTGGVAGGVIGHQSGNRTEGAIIGTVAGYALGTTMHRQKQGRKQAQRQLERERAEFHQELYELEITAAQQAAPAPAQTAEPEFTASERQQLLLQSAPLFTVRRSN